MLEGNKGFFLRKGKKRTSCGTCMMTSAGAPVVTGAIVALRSTTSWELPRAKHRCETFGWFFFLLVQRVLPVCMDKLLSTPFSRTFKIESAVESDAFFADPMLVSGESLIFPRLSSHSPFKKK